MDKNLLDVKNRSNSRVTSIEIATQEGQVSAEYVQDAVQRLKHYWKVVSELVDVNNLVEPSYVFIRNGDMGKILGAEGEMDLVYYYPFTNSIFINIDFKQKSTKIPNASMYNLLAQVVTSMIANEIMDNGELDARIYDIPTPSGSDDQITRNFQNQGLPFYMSFSAETTSEEIGEVHDTKNVYPYEAYKFKEVMDFLLGVILALKGSEIYGIEISKLKVKGRDPRHQIDSFELDYLSIDKERLELWMITLFKYLKYNKAYKSELNEVIGDDKLFKSIIMRFLDRSGFERKAFDKLVALTAKEELNGKDKKDIREIKDSILSFYSTTIEINDANLTSSNPIQNLLKDLLLRIGDAQFALILMIKRGDLES